TSSAPPSATSDRTSSVAGLIVSKYFFDFGGTNFPPMKTPYLFSIRTWSLDSGAGEYSQAPPNSSRGLSDSNFSAACRLPVFSSTIVLIGSVFREVVLVLVTAGHFLGQLHQQVVGQSRSAEAEEVRRQPRVSQRLLDEDQEMERLLGGLDAARRLH